MVEQANKQNTWYKTFEHFQNALNFATDCGYQAKVISYDKTKHIADIQSLANYSDGSGKAQMLEVPVSACCYEFDEWLEKVKDDLAKVDAYVADGTAMNTHFVDKIPKPLMKPGAIVIVSVMDNDTDNWDGSNSTYTPTSGRQHDINDSMIVGVIK